MLGKAFRAHPRVLLAGGALLAALVAIPVVAYVIVPALVRSTLVEDLPTAAPAVRSTAVASGVTGSAAPIVPTASAAAPETLSKGELVRISAGDYGTGIVRIVRVGADRFVRFEDVDIAGAPDMYVYLSNGTDGKPGTFLDLGKLKATNGSFNYAIPASVDLASVRSVVVWCRQFTVTVTYAVLRP